ncbi:glycosyltransferase [Patescibacteria group bacterium]|nr:glycosyltransferase [Patescibacteria group bacterium]
MIEKNYLCFEETENGVYRDGSLIRFSEQITHDPGKIDTSLIVTNFNRANTIQSAIESALACTQEKGGLEIIVVDDASTDESLEILRKMAKNRLIQLIALQKNTGSEALPKNIAAFFARGQYLSYLDSDDRIGERDAFDSSLKAITEDPSAVMTVSNLIFEIHCKISELEKHMPWLLEIDTHEPTEEIRDPRANEYRIRKAKEYSSYEMLTHGYYDALKLMRRDIFSQTGGVVEDLESCGDFGTYLRLTRHGRVIPVQRDFYVYTIHGSNDSFYSDEKAQRLERLHRQFALEEIRKRGLTFEDLSRNCPTEFWVRYNFTPDEIQNGNS